MIDQVLFIIACVLLIGGKATGNETVLQVALLAVSAMMVGHVFYVAGKSKAPTTRKIFATTVMVLIFGLPILTWLAHILPPR